MWVVWWGCVDQGPVVDPRVVADFDRSPVEKRSAPLLGGGVAVSARWVAASDVDGDSVRLRNFASGMVVDVPLATGWAPTQLAWNPDGSRLNVVLRGTGSVAVIDVDEAFGPLLLDVRPVCDAPRGLAADPIRHGMWIACGGGELVALDFDGQLVATWHLEPDLRDVVMVGDGRALVSRTKAVEVLVVDLDTGSIADRHAPLARKRLDEAGSRIPRLLRRLVADPGGGALALYQLHDQGPVDVEVPDPGTEPENTVDPVYGGGGARPECGSVVVAAVATVTADGGFEEETWFDESASGYIADLTIAAGEYRFATTNHDVARSGATSLLDIAPEGSLDCDSLRPDRASGAVGAGLATLGTQLWGATREPFALWSESTPLSTPTTSDFVPDTPLQWFHDAPHGIACASCHFDGDEDSHTWHFVPDGLRRTQPLGGLVVSETAPFHWDALLPTFDALFSVVGEGRMGLDAVDNDALLGWIDDLPRPPRLTEDPAAVEHGAALFSDPTVGCVACHSGWRLSNGASADVGTGGPMQVPSLIGVGARENLMHDGCAETLHARFDDPVCGGGDLHGVTSQLSSADIDALVAYLRTL